MRSLILTVLCILLSYYCNCQDNLSIRDSLIVEYSKTVSNHHLAVDKLEKHLYERKPIDTSIHLLNINLELARHNFNLNKVFEGYQYIEKSFILLNYVNHQDQVFKSEMEFYKGGFLYLIGSFDAAGLFLNSAIRNIAVEKESMDVNKADQLFFDIHRFAAGVSIETGDYELARFYLSKVESGLNLNNYEKFLVSINYTRMLMLEKKFQKASWMLESYICGDLFQNLTPFDIGLSKLNLGICLFELEEYDKAATYLKDTFPELHKNLLSQSIWGVKFLVELYAYRIKLAIVNKQFEFVDLHLKEGLKYVEILNKRSNNKIASKLLISAASAYLAQEDFIRAYSLLDSAAQILVADTTSIGPANLPRIYNNTIYSSEHFLELLEARQEIFEKEFELGDPLGLDHALLAYQTIDSFLRVSRESLSLTSSIGKAIQDGRKHHEHAIDIAMRLYRLRDDSKYLELAWQIAAAQKSNLLQRFIQAPLLAEAMNVPKGLIDQKTSLELKLLQFEKALGGTRGPSVDSITDSIIYYNQEITILNNRLTSNYPAFAAVLRGAKTVSLESAMEKLPEDQIFIEYFIGEDSIYVFTIDLEQGLVPYTLPIPQNFEHRIRGMIENPTDANLLFEELLKPVLSNKPKQAKRLQIIPDGILWHLPFAALRSDNKFLVRDYAISYVYSAAMAFENSRNNIFLATENKFAGFGLSYQSIIEKVEASLNRSVTDEDLLNLSSLPYAAAEVKTIGDIVSGVYWLEEEATETQFDISAPNYEQLHLAMHGVADPENPLENALIFAGNEKINHYSLLTTREILGKRLPAKLVVLSACHTGSGPLETGEGVQSMARAFAFAGAETTLASNWEASDNITHDILIDFYKKLEKGYTVDVALQVAINKYLDEASLAFRDPILWANLTLTGQTEAIKGKADQAVWYIIFALGTVLLVVFGLRRQLQVVK